MLYEMLVGETPEKTETFETMANNLCEGKINCGASEEVKNILARCFKRNVMERFDARAMLEAVSAELRRIQAKSGYGNSVVVGKTNGIQANGPNPVRHSQFVNPSHQQGFTQSHVNSQQGSPFIPKDSH